MSECNVESAGARRLQYVRHSSLFRDVCLNEVRGRVDMYESNGVFHAESVSVTSLFNLDYCCGG